MELKCRQAPATVQNVKAAVVSIRRFSVSNVATAFAVSTEDNGAITGTLEKMEFLVHIESIFTV